MSEDEGDGSGASEDEDAEPIANDEGAEPVVKKRVDMMRFLTSEDFARIEKLKRRQRQEGAGRQPKKSKTDDGYSDYSDAEAGSDDEQTGEVDDWAILGDYHSRRRRRKATYEERMDSIRAGREGREKFSSSKAKREKEGRSLSNREKRKTKDFRMISHKRSVVTKGKRKLSQKRRELRQHITKQKKKGF
ncbi:hypothetical protein GGH17_003021 [Coemansia sp. RSA 788]|nr:hypothetical protein GGH17_003021 [Coemansia sp. RSA 788]